MMGAGAGKVILRNFDHVISMITLDYSVDVGLQMGKMNQLHGTTQDGGVIPIIISTAAAKISNFVTPFLTGNSLRKPQ